MFSNFFTDVPDTADSIPEPLKEDGDINPNATKIHDNVPKNVRVNVNVNTKDLPEHNSPNGVDASGVSSDTTTLPDSSVREWTEPHNSTTAVDNEQAMESWSMCTRANRYKYKDSLDCALLQLKPASLAIYSDLHMAATENIGNFMFRGLTGVVNVFGHILNLFRTALFDGWRDFKRSELTAYCQSNIATISYLKHNGQVFDQCANISLYVPQGMVSNYSKTLDSMLAFLNELNLLDMSKQMLEVSDNILTNVRASNKVFGDVIRDVYAKYSNTTRLNLLFSETEKHMTTRKDDEMLCSKAFPDRSKGFSDVVDTLTTVGNSHLQSVASIHSRMVEIEETVKEIAENIDGKDLTRQQLDMLSKIARVWATHFDRFATVINDVYRIDHNVTLDIVQIRKFAEI